MLTRNLFSCHSHEKKSKNLATNRKRVLKGKYFPFFCRQTTHRPAEKFRPKHFFLSYMLDAYAGCALKNHRPGDTALARLCRCLCPLRMPLHTIPLLKKKSDD